MLQDNEVHTKCPVHRSGAVKAAKPSTNGKGKAKRTGKRKR